MDNTDKVENLNADLLDGKHGQDWVDGIKVGGRNLIKNSDWLQGVNTGWEKGGQGTAALVSNTPFEGKNTMFLFLSAGETAVFIQQFYTGIDIKVATPYTISWWYRLNASIADAFGGDGVFYLTAYNSSNTELLNSVVYMSNLVINEYWQRFVRTVTIPVGTVKIRVLFYGRDVKGNGNNIGFTNAQLEEGNKVTPWKPAHEDMVSLISNPNILHNWDWRNPINQRAYAEEAEHALSNAYFIDRWKLTGTAKIMKSGLDVPKIRLNAGAAMLQLFEQNLKGMFCTITVKRAGYSILEVVGLIFPTTTGESTYNIAGGRMYVTLGLNSYGYNYFKIAANEQQDVETLKVEVGRASTLHLDPPMDWAVELPKCQRFFVNMGNSPAMFGSIFSTAGVGALFMFLPVSMRATPSHSATEVSVRSTQGGNAATITATTLQQNLLKISFNTGTSSPAVNTPVYGNPTSSAFYLSAEP